MSLIIKSRSKQRPLGLDEPLRHGSHKKPVTRRDFLAQGFLTGAASVVAPGILGTLLSSHSHAAGLSSDIEALKAQAICNITGGAGKIPFICFDLAGGANIAGSNVLVGKQGGQLDFLTTQGYSKLGLPGDMLPNNATTNFIDTQFGLAFHTDSAFLRGMIARTSATTRARVNGAVIPARSENDTGNNPHNPMYGIARAGAKGELLTLIGSQNSESGGNSMAAMVPAMDSIGRPTKVDRAGDVTGLVDTGEVATILDPEDTVKVLETMARISKSKIGLNATSAYDETGTVSTGLPLNEDANLRKRMLCGYVKTADTVNTFGRPGELDPALDPEITSIFGANFGGDREFEKTAAVMKLVVPGYAGAGTISSGGFDYHTGNRSAGEQRDFRIGQCMGACLEYAARRGKPLMLYVFSDGSVSSNGMVDGSTEGRGKGVWTSDNQQTAAAFFLVFNPAGRPILMNPSSQQLGYFRPDGDVETAGGPAANNVNLLVQTVLLNYMALHGETDDFIGKFGNALGPRSALDGLIAFQPIA